MFRTNLLTMRRRKHLTQSALGAQLGVSATTIYKWEQGQCEPGIESLNTLARIFGVSVDELCGRTYDPEDTETRETIAMNRAFRRMTLEEQQKLLAVSRTLFSHAFEEQAP